MRMIWPDVSCPQATGRYSSCLPSRQESGRSPFPEGQPGHAALMTSWHRRIWTERHSTGCDGKSGPRPSRPSISNPPPRPAARSFGPSGSGPSLQTCAGKTTRPSCRAGIPPRCRANPMTTQSAPPGGSRAITSTCSMFIAASTSIRSCSRPQSSFGRHGRRI